ncbi:MAG: transposase [Alkaliphilus sp.]
MPRGKREKSETGIYHIMLRGIDRRDLFLDDNDKEKFIQILIKAKEQGGFFLYAYCLMDNHVHLLIKEDEEIGKSIKRVAVSYVQWHNFRHARTGHLFQNRYKSETVESESYFLTVLRYIHQNPVKAKMVRLASNYEWSSYRKYLDSYCGKINEIDMKITEGYFKDGKSFEIFMSEENSDKCLEFERKIKYTDKELSEIIESKYNIVDIRAMFKKDRDKTIKEIRKDTKASIKQLATVLGVGRGIVQKAAKNLSSETSP